MKLIFIIFTSICLMLVSFGQPNSGNLDLRSINLGSFSTDISFIEPVDLNQDGNNDIITSKNDSTILILKNTGNMHFKDHFEIEIDYQMIDLFALDFNKDGKMDIFINGSLQTYCYLQTDDLNFEEEILDASPIKLYPFDYDLDQKSELYFVKNNVIKELSYPNTKDSLLNFTPFGLNIINLDNVFFVDLDLDGACDILSYEYINYPTDGRQLITQFKQGINGFEFDTLFNKISNTRIEPKLFTDVDLDGDIDLIYDYILVSSYFLNKIGVLYFEMDTVVLDTVFCSIGSYSPPTYELGDLNNDGYIDILFGTHGNRFRLLGKYMNLGTHFEYHEIDKYQHLASDNYTYTDVSIFDINNNGSNDILFSTENINGIFYREDSVEHIISQSTAFEIFQHLNDNYFAINLPHFRYERHKGHIIHIDTFGGVQFSLENYNLSTFHNYDNYKGTTSKKIDLHNTGRTSLLVAGKWGESPHLSTFNDMNELKPDTTCFQNNRDISIFNTFLDINFDNQLEIISFVRDSAFIRYTLNCDSILEKQPLFSFDSVYLSNLIPAQLNSDFNYDFVFTNPLTKEIQCVEKIGFQYELIHTLLGKLKAVKDVNKDGLDDIFTDSLVYINTGNGFESQMYPEIHRSFIDVLDINGDEYMDIIMQDTLNNLYIYYSSAFQLFDSTYIINKKFPLYKPSNVFDMNEDGKDEFFADNRIDKGNYTYNHSVQSYLFIDPNAPLYKVTPTNVTGNNSEISESDLFYMYPNPTHDIIYYNSDDIYKEVRVYDSLGKYIKTIPLNGGKAINVSDLSPGLLFLRFENLTQDTFLKKIIKL